MVLFAEAVDIAEQQVGDRIAGAVVVFRRIKGQVTGVGSRSQFPPEFILLSGGDISAELQVVPSHNFGYVVAKSIRGIRVVNAVRNVTGVFAETTIGAIGIRQVNSWHHAVAVSAV